MGGDSPKKLSSSKGMHHDTRKHVVQKVTDMHIEEVLRQSTNPELIQEVSEKAEEEELKEPRRRWVQTTCADLFFGGWIILNALVLAIETDKRTDENDDSAVWFIGDSLFNTVFLVELVLRLEAERSRWICSLWNIFDAVLVAVSIWDSWMMRILGLDGELRFATLLRLFRLMRLVRVLRVLRLVRFLKQLMLLIRGVKSAIASMVWGCLLLCITIFILSLFLTKLVGKSCCDPDDWFQDEMYKEYFGTVVRSGFTLFQFTMEFQPDICRDTWKDGVWLTLVLIIYTGYTNICLLNIVASVIVENVLAISNEDKEQKEAEKEAMRQEKLALDVNKYLTYDEKTGRDSFRLDEVGTDERTNHIMELFGSEQEQAEYLFHVLDRDGSGDVCRKEFHERLLRVGMEVEQLDLMKLEHQVLMADRHFLEMKTEFENEQKENLNRVFQIESKQQGLKNRVRRAPSSMATESQAALVCALPPQVAGADDDPLSALLSLESVHFQDREGEEEFIV